MDQIREQLKNPLVVGITAFVIGAIFGLVILGWNVWPVEWTNAQPEHMSPSAQAEYLRMAIEAYGQNGDVAKAQARYAALGENPEEVMNQVMSDPQGLSPDLILQFNTSVTGGVPSAAPITGAATPMPGEATPAMGEATPVSGAVTAPPSAVPEEEEGGRNWLMILIPILCVLVLALGGVLLYIFVIRGRMGGGGGQAPVAEPYDEGYPQEMVYDEYAEPGSEPPVAQFMASFKLGDDLFDDSFSIDSPSGEFLVECGAGISEAIGVGEPKKVTAFEVWLFDKNDIQTVTKVLMSAHAFNDSSIRQRLEAKGEPVLAQPGEETLLETQTLSLVARVVDMSYGDGAAPGQSFFEHLVLELIVWTK